MNRSIAWLVAGSASVLVVAAMASMIATESPSAATPRCAAGATAAVVGGRRACLAEGTMCRKRYQPQYRRHGFVCRSGYLEFDWTPLRRRLHIPQLAPGSPCPAASPQGTIGQHGSTGPSRAPAFGPGPAYPVGFSADGGTATLVLVWPATNESYPGWAGTKVLWTVPRYYGAVLIRGGQLDGSNALGFDIGPQWTDKVLPELRFIGPELDLHPAATFVRAPGCYAYQVDTRRSSYVIVFEALLK